jgi:hypothetical protein
MHVLYLVALLGGGILLIGLINKKNKPTTKEGFKMPKFPSVNDITKPIKDPIQAQLKKIDGLGKQIKGIEKNITKKITGGFNAITKQIVGGFNAIFDWIKQGIAFLIFFPQCFLWYSIHIFGYVLYAPIAFFVWVFSIQSIEKLVFKYIEMADKLAHQATGVHLFHFSDNIQARCYFSKSKLRELREKRRAEDPSSSSSSWDDPAIDDSDAIGYLVFVVSILVVVSFIMSIISN